MRDFTEKKIFAVAAIAFLLMLQGCSGKTLRIAPHTELKVFDPIWTTAYITRDHGYLVYDTLFSMNEMYEPEPQMVNTWSVSADKKLWTFQLREGLKWHDGTSVTAEDCIASLQRWGKRDGLGQMLFRDIESLSVKDSLTFNMKLRRPNESVLQMLAKLSSNVPFMMPKRLAQSSPYAAIQEPIGSGPFIFNKKEWVPGSKVVYVKNKNYVPRKEPVSLAAGGKVAKVDRIVWKFYPDQAAATQALIDGEVDYMQSPSTKMIPLLEGKKEITLAFTDPLGNVSMARFNTLIPPFDDVDVRRAAIMAMDQGSYMTAALGDQKYWKTCYSVFPCGTQFENEVGNELMKVGNTEAAKEALKASSYAGVAVVILNPIDSPVISALTQVTVDKLREIGMKVDVRDMTWASLTEQRASQESVANGGWNMFHTWWIAADLSNPLAIAFSGNRDSGWFGWPEDAQLESLRSAFEVAKSQEEAQEIAGKIQARLFDIGALAVLGQFFEPVAYSNKVYGVTSPIHFFSNMSFEAPE